MEEPKCPEHDKLSKIAHLSQKCWEFLTWLVEEKHIELAIRHEHSNDCFGADGFRACGIEGGALVPACVKSDELLAEFFGIDSKKLEEEKKAVLDFLRVHQEERNRQMEAGKAAYKGDLTAEG